MLVNFQENTGVTKRGWAVVGAAANAAGAVAADAFCVGQNHFERCIAHDTKGVNRAACALQSCQCKDGQKLMVF